MSGRARAPPPLPSFAPRGPALCNPPHPSRHRNRRHWVRHQRRSLACSRSHAAPHHRVQGGILPLQYATTHQASYAVLRMLLDAHPEAGDAMDEAAEAAGELSQLPKVGGDDDGKRARSTKLDVEMGLRQMVLPPDAAAAAAASAAQQLSTFQGAALCQLPPADQALVPSTSGPTAVELPMQTVMTLTLTGEFATFNAADFKARLAARLDLQVQQITVKKKRPKSYVVGTSASAVDGIAVEVDEDSYLLSTGGCRDGAQRRGAAATGWSKRDDADLICAAIRVALKPIKIVAKDAIRIEWVERDDYDPGSLARSRAAVSFCKSSLLI